MYLKHEHMFMMSRIQSYIGLHMIEMLLLLTRLLFGLLFGYEP